MSGHDHGQRSDDAIFSDWIGPKGCEAVYDIIISVENLGLVSFEI